MRSSELYVRLPEQIKNRLSTVKYDKLSHVEKRTLQLILITCGSRPFEWEQLNRQSGSTISGAELRIGLIGLRQQGVVFTFRKAWGEHVYTLALDQLGYWVKEALPGLDPNVEGLNDISSKVESESSGRELAFEVLYLLSYIAKNELQLTQKGIPHKKQLMKLEEGLSLNQPLLARLKMKYSHQDVYSPGLALVMDAAMRLGLIEQEEQGFKLIKDKLGSWLSKPLGLQQQELYRLWTEIYTPLEVWQQLALAGMESLPERSWFPVSALMVWLSNYHQLPTAVSLEEAGVVWWEQGIEIFAEMGWVEVGHHSKWGNIFRWKLPVHEYGFEQEQVAIHSLKHDGFFVQPDFEIIVPPDIPFTVRWELECFCEIVRNDQVMVYLLTKDSVYRAYETGRDQEDLLQFLRQHAKFGVPDNVVMTIEQWSGQYGKVYFSETTLLRCLDEHIAKQVSSDPKLQSICISRIGTKDFIVASDKRRECMILLKKLGIHLKMQPESEDAQSYPKFAFHETLILQEHVRSKGMVYTNTTVQYYDMEKEFPEKEDAFPKLREIPAIWMKENRIYHASTKREMMERAIQLQTFVKLRANGVEWAFIPTAIREEHNQWSVLGSDYLEMKSLYPEDWEEMRFIIPGLNEK